jgi:hypothetical protein
LRAFQPVNATSLTSTAHLCGSLHARRALHPEPEEDEVAKELRGTCFCGAVEVSVKGEPKAMGYCHCESCRQWSAGPVNAFSLWDPSAVSITRGEENIATYHKTDRSKRAWCKTCGGHLFTEHPKWGVTDVYAAIIPELKFAPAVHVNYQETVLHIKDGLPKLKDFPAEMGGSGQALPD